MDFGKRWRLRKERAMTQQALADQVGSRHDGSPRQANRTTLKTECGARNDKATDTATTARAANSPNASCLASLLERRVGPRFISWQGQSGGDACDGEQRVLAPYLG